MVNVMMSYLKQSLIIFRRLRMTGCLELTHAPMEILPLSCSVRVREEWSMS